LHHVLLTSDFTIFVNTIGIVSIGYVAGLTRGAVTALVHGRAFLSQVPAESSVNGASLVSDVVVVDVLVHVQGITTVAAQIRLHARDHHLGRQIDIGPGTFTCDLDAIGER